MISRLKNTTMKTLRETFKKWKNFIKSGKTFWRRKDYPLSLISCIFLLLSLINPRPRSSPKQSLSKVKICFCFVARCPLK